ncbi:penicillin acylase family protein [Spirosoma sp. KCTC 42546]|uniref:penicillin acylase family protein n=1 Tax=Spirosoma sp. KCTC 42546 TaxID=2520506 RepID=UPI001159FAF0|nr:penicillin acylase family protein [Spirosoma sp. KCTC 42546]QDK79997.1 penicillin acylase family protein [Spirosoma sp. KCTC 42546]
MKPVAVLILLFLAIHVQAQPFSPEEIGGLNKQAKRITIIKDKWGVPHVYAKTDAEAVFGMMYVQCEEFFDNVESSIISRLGRQAEVDGESALYKDLWSRMFIDSSKAVALYQQSPNWLRKLCDGYADGINFYMISHPGKKPKLITRVQPWVALMNNIPSLEGSNISEADFRAFYADGLGKALSFSPLITQEYQESSGSNGWALAPSRTQSKNAMLLINPHAEFYGRIEIQVVSKQGLNAYGAPFLGQFNIFQGFNEFLGWMHPVSLSDAKDLFTEQVEQKNGQYFYRFDGTMRPVDSTAITLQYKQGGGLSSRKFVTYRTHHGPVVASFDKKWVTLKNLDANIDLLAMHWEKMKARNFKEFQASINKRAMTGSNVVYADRDGNIAYWHGNFVPKKNPSFDWKRPVDGSILTNDWQGTHELAAIPQYINPANGWVQNCNSTPLYGTGVFDSLMSKKPVYMLPDGQTPRAVSAIRVLTNLTNASIDDVITAAHDPYLPNGERHIPKLIAAYETLKADTAYAALAAPIQTLQAWNFRADSSSVATILAVSWLEKIIELNVARLKKPVSTEERYSITNGATISTDVLSAKEMLDAFTKVISDLKKDFGTWEIAWGTINRYQRVDKGTSFSDAKPSWAVNGTPGFMGSLNAYVSKKGPQTQKRYGITGNTFAAVVEFGKTVKGKSILTGGSSSDPNSSHFTDQVDGYRKGVYKDILFYKKDVMATAEKTYHPGE